MSQGISNDALNNLTATNKVAQVRNYVWYDISDADLSLNDRVLVSDTTGRLTLSKVDANNWKLGTAVPLIDELFQDLDGDDYYQSYLTNYKNLTHTSANLDISHAFSSTGDSNDVISFTHNARNSSDLVFNLNNMLRPMSADQEEELKVQMTTSLDFLPGANVTDISNTLTVKMHNFGTENLAGTHNFNFATAADVTFETNALTDNAKLVFASDAAANDAEFNSNPQPSLLLATMFDAEYPLSAGHRSKTINVVPPARDAIYAASGAWNWKAKIVDGDYESAEVSVRVVVSPALRAPVRSPSSFDAFNALANNSKSVFLKYNALDLTDPDIALADSKMDISYQLVDSSGKFAVVAGANNMDTVRDSDASANFTITYTAGSEYSATNVLDSVFKLLWREVGSSSNYNVINMNLFSTGAIARDPVTVTNNYNGTYTLAGGNKQTGEVYITRVGAGAWSLVSVNPYVATGTHSDRHFAVGKFTTVYNAYTASDSGAVEVDNVLPAVALAENATSFNAETSSSSTIVQMDEDGNIVGSTGGSSTTSYTLIADNTIDLSVNVTKPNWFDDENMSLRIAIAESPVAPGTQYNLTSFALTTGLDTYTGTMPTSGTGARTAILDIDASANEQFAYGQLNLVFAGSRYNKSTLTITTTLYRNGSSVSTDSDNYLITSTINSNPGAHNTNFLMVNRSKVNLTRTTGTMSAATRLVPTDFDVSESMINDISANSYRNLASYVNGMLYLNVARDTFVGSGHAFDLSGFNITQDSGNGQEVKVYIPYSKYPGFDLNSVTGADAAFSSYPDIFIDTGYYTGALDVAYSTIFEGDYSATLNTMRLIVLPRPGITYTVTDPANNHNDYNSPSYISQSVGNVQVDACGNNVAFTTPTTFGGDDISALLARYTAIARVGATVPAVTSVTSETDSVIPSGTNVAGLFTAETDLASSIAYGTSAASTMKFAGLNLDSTAHSDLSGFHILTFNAAISYIRNLRLSDRALPINDDFVITVVDDNDRVYAAELMADQLYLNNGIAVNGLDFMKYVRVDADVNIFTDYSRADHIYVENIGPASINVVYTGAGAIVSLDSVERAYFKKNGGDNWSFVRKVVHTIYPSTP